MTVAVRSKVLAVHVSNPVSFLVSCTYRLVFVRSCMYVCMCMDGIVDVQVEFGKNESSLRYHTDIKCHIVLQ